MLAKAIQSAAKAVELSYIEDVFSTYLYTGNGSTQTITNGIDLAGKGGMVWIKSRTQTAGHCLFDTARGPTKYVVTNITDLEYTNSGSLTQFNSEGFNLGLMGGVNSSGANHASWTFRKAPKFFDVVTYTGNGSNRTIAHNLGSVPGCIIVKRTDTTADWQVYHRSLANTEYMVLNTTAAKATGTTRWNSTTPTSTVFSLGTDTTVNANGGTYVAYLFAHNAGGFGLTGADNVISCGSFVGASGDVNLGYEPQFMLFKRSDGTSDWNMVDTMRGWTTGAIAGNNPSQPSLQANVNYSETSSFGMLSPTATGFMTAGLSGTYIYIAIRRGPMKTPTSGTSVFGLNARTGTGANATVTGSAGVSDAVLIKNRGAAVGDLFASRLTGTGYLETSSTAAEVAAGTTILQANPWDVMDGVKVGTTSTITNASSNTYINYLFDRAPGFFDVVCFNVPTGNSNQRISHNLTVVPELIIVRDRTGGYTWLIYSGNINSYLSLNNNNAITSPGSFWGSSAPTSTDFGINAGNFVLSYGNNCVAYLFASCPGVSKVGSYTGNGTNQTINCGFTGGARFILIKRTDSTGDWYVWDTARGIVTGNDPRLSLNSTAAEVTTDDTIDPANSGFIVNQLAATNVNVNAATYIYLAIA